MIISIGAKKPFNKIQQAFMIKTPQEVGIEGRYPQHKKDKYDRLTANIIFNGKKLKAFPLRSGTR